MKRLAILGAGGHGKVVADAAELVGWNVSFFDDNCLNDCIEKTWPVLGNFNSFFSSLSSFEGVIVGIGNNKLRLMLCRKILEFKAPLVSIIHPKSVVSRYVELEAGTVVFAGAVVNPGVKAGLALIVNTSASIDHDCRIGNGVHVSPGARIAGEVTVGDLSWIGIGSSVRQRINIGKKAMVGAGSAVVSDVRDDQTVFGVPASLKK